MGYISYDCVQYFEPKTQRELTDPLGIPEAVFLICDTVVAFIESNQDKSALHLHPDDVALLEGEAIGVPMIADKAMHRGCVRLETADGWVEDGPDVRLSRLRALMDDMEGKS